MDMPVVPASRFKGYIENPDLLCGKRGRFQDLCGKILELQKAQFPPESDECQQLTKEYWSMIQEFTKGDVSLLSKLVEFGKLKGAENEWEKNQLLVNQYMEPALDVYFSRLGINPFEEDSL